MTAAGGEADVRGCFTALATAHILGLNVEELGNLSNAADFVRRCQLGERLNWLNIARLETYEGGLAGEPGNEAHGGYAFCGVAALALMGRLDVLDMRCVRQPTPCDCNSRTFKNRHCQQPVIQLVGREVLRSLHKSFS
eukprot:scaffold232482_cov19-Prasinocladus_malaysianus.AAC.1